MLMLILAVVVAIFLFYYFIVKPYDYWKDKGVKQGNPMWIAGDNWKLLLRKESFIEMGERLYNQHPGVRYSGMYQFFEPTLLLKDPDLIKQVTVKDFDHFTDHKSFIPEFIDPLWGKNLLSLKGQKWRDMRSILSPSFTSSKMKSMFVLISECAENFVQHFLEKNENVVTIEFKETFTRFANDVIATTAFGLKVDSLGQPENQFYLMGKEATNNGFWRTFKIFGFLLFPKLFTVSKENLYVMFNALEKIPILELLKIGLFSKKVSTFFQKIVRDTIIMREEKNIVRPDMIHQLLEARRGMQEHDQEDNDVVDIGFSTAQECDLVKSTKLPRDITDMDITAQAIVFFFAGFESVSGLMCFLAYELAINPDIQNRLRQEVIFTLEEHKNKLTYAGLLKMKYMDMVVSGIRIIPFTQYVTEVLRKWSIFQGTDRICTKPYTIQPTRPDEQPLHLKKGDMVWLPMHGIHHDPKYFPDPDRFDPERFNDENKGKIKPYTYFPFGVGPRNCIGSRLALLETKTVMFHILRHFELVPVEKSVIPIEISKKQFNLTAEGGFWFGLKRINVKIN